jgi:hypothetical protein
MRLSLVVMSVVPLLSSCGSQVDANHGEPAPDPAPLACGGTLGAEPRRIAGGLSEGWLFADGDHLVHAAAAGEIRRIDRCTGDTELLGEALEIADAAVADGSVYVVEPSEEASLGRLLRVPIAGGELETIAEVPGERLVAHGSTVYVKGAVGPEGTDVGVYGIDAAGAAVLLHEVDTWDGMKQVSLIGASDAGIYFKVSYDCGCNPGLELLPFDGSEITSVENTEGAFGLAAVGADLFVAADLESLSFGSVVLDVIRLPLTGGEPEILVAANEEHTYDVRRIAASETAVCWQGYGNAPRCIRREPGATLRVMDATAAPESPLDVVVAEDAAYWTRPEAGGGELEVVGAVP